ncbi:receptor-interacting serine/threonine-protein kinase 3-like [Megalops cyprinoides]|uniref:receptor-interacting serine/threonine-protein kinase 3-like n=1 Tax=Megalops cyprinoides TaxID=118141 RepID=UPI001863DCD4|nr:receptor-interacting serine/threonine-protein kinase 3-like [Megalops cyprinoides]
MAYPASVVLIGNSSLQFLDVIGSGGFGQIYKAKHTEWGVDVAVKMLHYDDGGSSLLKEAELMRKGGSTYVLRILGVYQGVPPDEGPSSRVGLVMEFMERGSLASLQERLSGPPPWPLAFRLAHQIALGMNFLHCLNPPLLHCDLKPGNVLLDDGLSVKLTDFGLAKLLRISSTGSKQEEGGGTTKFMPPEAFDLSYKPTPKFDVYSYAVLLWTIITGEKPYCHAWSTLVKVGVPDGARPDMAAVDSGRVEGLGSLVELMKNCWDSNPEKRPFFKDCLPVTEKVFEQHKRGINAAVYKVQLLLDSQGEDCMDAVDAVPVLPAQSPVRAAPAESMKTVPLPTQETGRLTTNHEVEGAGQTLISEGDWSLSLMNILDDLTGEQFSRMKSLMRSSTMPLCQSIPREELEAAGRQQLAELMMDHLGENDSILATQALMREIPRNDSAMQQMLEPFVKQVQAGAGQTLIFGGAWRRGLMKILDDLTAPQFSRMKWLMKISSGSPCRSIPRADLDTAGRQQLADLMIEHLGENNSILATQALMRKIPRNDSAMQQMLEPFVKQVQAGGHSQ